MSLKYEPDSVTQHISVKGGVRTCGDMVLWMFERPQCCDMLPRYLSSTEGHLPPTEDYFRAAEVREGERETCRQTETETECVRVRAGESATCCRGTSARPATDGETIFIELMTSDRKLNASREGSK